MSKGYKKLTKLSDIIKEAERGVHPFGDYSNHPDIKRLHKKYGTSKADPESVKKLEKWMDKPPTSEKTKPKMKLEQMLAENPAVQGVLRKFGPQIAQAILPALAEVLPEIIKSVVGNKMTPGMESRQLKEKFDDDFQYSNDMNKMADQIHKAARSGRNRSGFNLKVGDKTSDGIVKSVMDVGQGIKRIVFDSGKVREFQNPSVSKYGNLSQIVDSLNKKGDKIKRPSARHKANKQPSEDEQARLPDALTPHFQQDNDDHEPWYSQLPNKKTKTESEKKAQKEEKFPWDDEEEQIKEEMSPAEIQMMRNQPQFRGMTDDQIRSYLEPQLNFQQDPQFAQQKRLQPGGGLRNFQSLMPGGKPKDVFRQDDREGFAQTMNRPTKASPQAAQKTQQAQRRLMKMPKL